MGASYTMNNAEFETKEKKFLEYYDLYNDSIFRYCLYKTNDRNRAVDLTQEVFLKAWEYVSQGNTVRNSKSLLFTIANHLVVDSYRKKKSESLDSLLESGFDPTHDEKPIQDLRDDTETANALLNSLEGKHKEVIILRYIEELSVKEIAKIMNESENTTSVRIHRALEKLKQASTQYE